jgi:hypothetical protein
VGLGDELAVDAADAHRADRAAERNVGDHQRGGSAVDAEDIGIVLAVGGEERGDDLRVVEVALGEKGAQRAVRHATGEDFLFRGTAFALEVAAGDFADRGGAFAVFDGQREEVLAFLDLGRGDGGDDDERVAVADGDRAVGELGQLAGFDDDGVGAKGSRHRVNGGHDFLSMGLERRQAPDRKRKRRGQ